MRILTNLTLKNKFQHWPKLMNSNVLKNKNTKQVSCEKEVLKTFNKKFAGSTWISSVFHKVLFNKKVSKSNRQEVDISEKVINSLNDVTQDTIQPENISKINNNNGVTSSSTHSLEEDPVSLRSYFRYSMNNTDRRSFQYRRITQPFIPVYEVEWQKNQWLQLDKSTNKQIEGLRKNGFSKVPIRKDTILMKHIMYDDPSELDILLELNLSSNKNQENLSQTTPFSVRRTRWWQTSYEIGKANLPSWVDHDICCTPSIPSVFTIVKQNPTKLVTPLQYAYPPL